MTRFLTSIINRKSVTWLALIIAAISFNNWLLALGTPHLILLNGADVSELSADGQPHAVWFRSLDILAGGTFIVFALLLQSPERRTGTLRLLRTATLTLGLSNIVDAINHLSCSWTADKACVIDVNLSWQYFAMPFHAYSSVVIAICFMALPLVGFFIARQLHAHLLRVISLVMFLAALEANLAFIYQLVAHQSFRAPSWEINQETQMLLLSIWFILLGITLLGRPAPSDQQVSSAA